MSKSRKQRLLRIFFFLLLSVALIYLYKNYDSLVGKPILPLTDPCELYPKEITCNQNELYLKLNQTPKNNLTVHFIDVGQGDSTLIQLEDFTMLVDCGDKNHGNDVINYLKQNNIIELDILVATHADADHTGGCAQVLQQTNTTTVWDNGQEKDTQAYKNYIKVAKQKDLKIINMGDSIRIPNGYIIVLNPDQQDLFSDYNQNSIVLMIIYGKQKFLLTGDCEEDCEARLTKYQISSQILKAGHHGSKTSSSQVFLDKVKPELAVVSVGKNNRYGHPHQEVLDRLSQSNIAVIRTDQLGTIVITTNSQTYLVLSNT